MIFKIKKVTPPYTQIHNNIIDNPDLSGKAKWILIYLLSKPGNWQVYENDIQRHCTDGRHSIRSGIKELIESGYIKRGERLRNEKGHVKGYEYEVHEMPIKSSTSSCVRFPYVGKPALSNINSTNTDEIPHEAIEEYHERMNEMYHEMTMKDVKKAGLH